MRLHNLKIIRSKKLLIILSIIFILILVLVGFIYIQKKNPNLWSEISNKSKSSSSSVSVRSDGYLYFNKYESSKGVYNLSLVRVKDDGSSEKEIVKASNLGSDYFNFSKISPDKTKIYIPGVGIYNLQTQKLIPYEAKAPARRDCTWFNNSEKLACIYESNHGALKQTVKITTIDLLQKEDVQFEKNISEEDNSLFYAALFPLGVRNNSEVIFRVSDQSIFVKYDLKTKKLSTIFDYRNTIKKDFGNFGNLGNLINEGQTDKQNSTVYLNSLDKIAFIKEVTIHYDENDPKSINKFAGMLSLLDLETGKVEELYSTGFGPHIISIENLKVSTDEKTLGFQLYSEPDDPMKKGDKFVIVDLISNKVTVTDFPSLNIANSYGEVSFKGFSNSNDPIFEFNLNTEDGKDVTFEYQIAKYNVATKSLKKIIGSSVKVPLSPLSLDNSFGGGSYGYNLAQIW